MKKVLNNVATIVSATLEAVCAVVLCGILALCIYIERDAEYVVMQVYNLRLDEVLGSHSNMAAWANKIAYQASAQYAQACDMLRVCALIIGVASACFLLAGVISVIREAVTGD